jgi:cyclopropane fatty-acyl-phospholipid synthase-like methyltransferase
MAPIQLRDGLTAGGAPRMWERIIRESLASIRSEVPPGSRVLEVGYGDGLLSCYMAAEMNWQLTGLDVRPAAVDAARAAARAHGLENQVEFRLVQPELTRTYTGSYDAMFVKTVFS